jgi:hypothetical protein
MLPTQTCQFLMQCLGTSFPIAQPLIPECAPRPMLAIRTCTTANYSGGWNLLRGTLIGTVVACVLDQGCRHSINKSSRAFIADLCVKHSASPPVRCLPSPCTRIGGAAVTAASRLASEPRLLGEKTPRAYQRAIQTISGVSGVNIVIKL